MSLSSLQIGLIASATQTSGSDRYYFQLLRALRDLGDDVDGVVLGDVAAIDDALPTIRSFAPEGTRALGRWRGLRETVRPLVAAADLVVSHMAPHVFPVLDIVRRKPLVEHFHGPWALEGVFGKIARRRVVLRHIQERAVYGRASRIVVLSKAYGEILERDYGIGGGKIRVIPGGVDVARFDVSRTRTETRSTLALPADRPIVLTVRRLESTKGVDRLIAAIDIVRRRVPEVLLVVVGAGSLRALFERQVLEAGLGAHVHFAGLVLDPTLVAAYYRAADLSVVPSVAFEGFGLVCTESFASGTPALVTPIGGLPEAVEGLDRSLIFANSGVDAIADGIASALLGRVPLPSEDACRAFAERFAWPEIARRVREVYAEVV